mmetsp:Transcript_45049/g.90921  ORF Transcript_45049/g.90921 Transcript_45049/m.90921 type:complete len:314 (-) Transcript_45049:18-959(-)
MRQQLRLCCKIPAEHDLRAQDVLLAGQELRALMQQPRLEEEQALARPRLHGGQDLVLSRSLEVRHVRVEMEEARSAALHSAVQVEHAREQGLLVFRPLEASIAVCSEEAARRVAAEAEALIQADGMPDTLLPIAESKLLRAVRLSLRLASLRAVREEPLPRRIRLRAEDQAAGAGLHAAPKELGQFGGLVDGAVVAAVVMPVVDRRHLAAHFLDEVGALLRCQDVAQKDAPPSICGEVAVHRRHRLRHDRRHVELLEDVEAEGHWKAVRRVRLLRYRLTLGICWLKHVGGRHHALVQAGAVPRRKLNLSQAHS